MACSYFPSLLLATCTLLVGSIVVAASNSSFLRESFQESECFSISSPDQYVNAPLPAPFRCGLHCEGGFHRQVCGGRLYGHGTGPELSMTSCRHLYDNATCKAECVIRRRAECYHFGGSYSRTHCDYYPEIPGKRPNVMEMRSCTYTQRLRKRRTRHFSFTHGQSVLFSRHGRNADNSTLATACDCLNGTWMKHVPVTSDVPAKLCQWMYKERRGRPVTPRRRPLKVKTPQWSYEC